MRCFQTQHFAPCFIKTDFLAFPALPMPPDLLIVRTFLVQFFVLRDGDANELQSLAAS
jgi:hypothetical protein